MHNGANTKLETKHVELNMSFTVCEINQALFLLRYISIRYLKVIQKQRGEVYKLLTRFNWCKAKDLPCAFFSLNVE